VTWLSHLDLQPESKKFTGVAFQGVFGRVNDPVCGSNKSVQILAVINHNGGGLWEGNCPWLPDGWLCFLVLLAVLFLLLVEVLAFSVSLGLTVWGIYSPSSTFVNSEKRLAEKFFFELLEFLIILVTEFGDLE